MLRDITVLALCAALLVTVQVALAVLPNIELVSLLVMLFTLHFKWRVLFVIYVFALVEGLIFGFHPEWWFAYLYVWTILAGLTWLCRRATSPMPYAVLSGCFGLAFGPLCSLPFLVVGGPYAFYARWLGDIPFDLVHGAGNFVVCLTLWKPLDNLLGRVGKK